MAFRSSPTRNECRTKAKTYKTAHSLKIFTIYWTTNSFAMKIEHKGVVKQSKPSKPKEQQFLQQLWRCPPPNSTISQLKPTGRDPESYFFYWKNISTRLIYFAEINDNQSIWFAIRWFYSIIVNTRQLWQSTNFGNSSQFRKDIF